MEIRLRLLLLISILALSQTGCSLLSRQEKSPDQTATVDEISTANESTAAPTTTEVVPPVFEPTVERRKIKITAIDSENFEVGPYIGLLSIEDFGTNSVYGLRAAYHITEGMFFEAAVGHSRGGKTSAEQFLIQVIADKDRDFDFYSLSLGLNTLPGEVFVGTKRTYNSALYFIGGIGSTQFAGDDKFTLNVGFGYRVLANDWLALHLDMRDYMFDLDVLGSKKVTHNFSSTLGITFFF